MLFHNDQATIFRSAQKFGTYVALTFEPFWIGKHSNIEADDRTARPSASFYWRRLSNGDTQMETTRNFHFRCNYQPGTFTMEAHSNIRLVCFVLFGPSIGSDRKFESSSPSYCVKQHHRL